MDRLTPIVLRSLVFSSFLLCALEARGQVVPGSDAVLFVVEGQAVTASGSSGTPLAQIGGTDLVHFSPFVFLSAEKVQTNAHLNAILGDHDADGDFAENFIGSFDALDVPFLPAPKNKTRTIYDYVFSTSLDFAPILDGDVFRFVAGGPAGDSVQVVFSEAQFVAAVGADDGDVDVDAFCQDVQGDVYFSFAADELVGGSPVPDGAVFFVPASAITYDGDGVAVAVTPGSAVVVLDEPDVDALVQNSPVAHTNAVGDVTALALDLNAGTFVGADGAAHPNLVLSGEALGPNLISTIGGGTIATGNFGAPLGAANPNPFVLGLGAMTGHLGAVTMKEDFGRALTTDVFDPEVVYPGETFVEWEVGNAVPNSTILFFVDTFFGAPGGRPTSTFVFGKVYPEIYPFPVAWNLVFALPTDSLGIAKLTGTLTHPISPYVLIGQPYDAGAPLVGFPEQLGAPAAIWFP